MQTHYKIKEVEKKFKNELESNGVSNTFVFIDNGLVILYNYCTGWFTNMIRYPMCLEDIKYGTDKFCYYKINNINQDCYLCTDKFIGIKKLVIGSQDYEYDIKNKTNYKTYNKKTTKLLFDTRVFY